MPIEPCRSSVLWYGRLHACFFLRFRAGKVGLQLESTIVVHVYLCFILKCCAIYLMDSSVSLTAGRSDSGLFDMLHYQQRSFLQHSQHRNCVRKRSVCASQDAGCFFPAWRRGVGRGGKGTGKETIPYLGWKLIWDRFVPGAPCIKPDCTAGCSPGHLSFRWYLRLSDRTVP
jgi:hypothetical protein